MSLSTRSWETVACGVFTSKTRLLVHEPPCRASDDVLAFRDHARRDPVVRPMPRSSEALVLSVKSVKVFGIRIQVYP